MANPNQTSDDLYALPPMPAVPDNAHFEQVSPQQVQAEIGAPRAAAPTRADVIRRAVELDVDPRLALSIWSQESSSGRNPRTSDKGAIGGFQVIPGTGRAMIGDKDLSDPWNNMEAGLRYIAYGQKTLGTRDPALLAAGYHAGYDRKDLKAGVIPGTSDGHITTAAYAAQVAGRAGGTVPDVTGGGRFELIAPSQAATLGLPPLPDASAPKNDGMDDRSRYETLSPADLTKLGIKPVEIAPPVAPAAKAPEPSWSDKAGYLGKSLKAGAYDLLGAGARVLDAVNPWTLSESDAAVLFKNDPAKLKEFQDNSSAMILSRFAHAMTSASEDTMKQAPKAAQDYYKDKVYATTDPSKAAYLEPTKVISDAVRSLPTMAALAITTYFTRGAATQAERTALAEGMSAEAARAAAVQAGAKAAAKVGAASEGTVGYGQQAEQTWADASKTSPEDMAKSPVYQDYLKRGFTPEAARAKVIADTAEQSGKIAGIVDAAVNHYGGHFLGKFLSEGGSFVPRVMKGFANEAATEAVQSGGEQYGQNLATQQNIKPDQDLTEGVAENIAQGFAVGGVSGGAAAGIGGRGHDGVKPQAAPQQAPATPEKAAPQPAAPAAEQPAEAAAQPAQPAAPVAPVAPAPEASTAAGPLTRSVENAADKHADDTGTPRVTATAKNGASIEGQLHAYQEDGQGGFQAQLVGDDGQVYMLSDKDGVQLTAQEHAAGPLSGAVQNVAEEEPKPVAPVAPQQPAQADLALPPQEPARAPRQPVQADLSAMSEDDLRARLKYIASQAKSTGGWSTMLIAERKRVEKEINARASAAPAQPEAQTAPQPVPTGPFATQGEANASMLKAAEATGQPHEVVPQGDQFTIQPIKEEAHGSTGLDAGHGRGDSSRAAVLDGGDLGRGTDGNRRVPASAGSDAGTARSETAAPAAGASQPADAQPALSEPTKDAHPGKRFGSREKGGAYLAKQGIADTHEVVQTGKVRFEVKPKAALPQNEEAAPVVAAKTEEQGAQAQPVEAAKPAPVETSAAIPASQPEPKAEAKPEKKADAKPTKDEHAKRWFGSEDKARAYLTKQKIGDTHTVKQTGRARFEIVPKEASRTTIEEAQAKHERQDQVVQAASDAIAERKAASTTGANADTTGASKEPWQMTAKEWNDAREAVRPNVAQSKFTKGSGSEATGNHERLQRLLYGVTDAARDRIRDAQAGKAKLSPDELEQLMDRINSPVNHRDVIEKALADGKPVPADVLAEYPDLPASRTADGATEQKPIEPVAEASPAEATHAEQDESEPASAPVIAASIEKAAKAEKMKPSEMRQWLVGQIDEAIKAARAPDGTITTGLAHTSRGRKEFHAAKGTPGETGSILLTVREGHDGTWTMSETNGRGKSEQVGTFKAEGLAAARKEVAALLERASVNAEGKTVIGQHDLVTFDVPGDGTFNVPNTVAELTAFKKRVLAAEGFKDKPAGKALEAVPEAKAESAPQEQDGEAKQDGEEKQDNAAPEQAQPDAANAPDARAVADEPPPEEAQTAGRKVAEAGEELTYNRRNRIRTGIKWSDVEGMNDALKAKETVKAKVWPKPDYEALIAEGMPPLAAHLVKQVYDSLSSKPQVRGNPGDAEFKSYIEAMGRLQDGVLAWARDPQSVAAWAAKNAGRAAAMLGRGAEVPQVAGGKSLLETVYPDGWRNHQNEVVILGGNKLLQALQPGYSEATKASKEVAAGWPAPREAWQVQGYKIVPKADWSITESGFGKFNLRAGSRFESQFDSREQAQAALAQAPAFTLADKYGRPKGTFDSEEAAREAARELVKRDGKEAPIEEGMNVADVERTGTDRRKGEDVTAQRLMDDFGFRGVNFGKWVPDNERQLHLNHAFDSFHDLAEVLGVPPKAMSLNGMLGIAFGAQGGGKALAHFVPGVNEINITRTNGAGSLAHEFGHALDHYFAAQAGLSTATDPFLTAHVTQSPTTTRLTKDADGKTVREEVERFAGLRPEVRDAFRKIVETMEGRQETKEEMDARLAAAKNSARKRVDQWLDALRRDFKGAEDRFDLIAARIHAGDLGEGTIKAGKAYLSPTVNALRDLYKQATGRTYSLDQVAGLQANIDHWQYVNDDQRAARTHVPQKIATDYAKQAAELDKNKGGKGYWRTPWEMFARAFDAYVSDELDENAAKNTYLSHAGRNDKTTPAGSEREAINQSFADLIHAIEVRDEDGKPVMYSVSGEDGKIPSGRLKESVLTQWGKVAEPVAGFDYLSGRIKKNNRGIFIIDGIFDRDTFKKVMAEAAAAGLDTKKLYIVAESASYTSQSIDLSKFADFAEDSIKGRRSDDEGPSYSTGNTSGTLDRDSLRQTVTSGVLGPVIARLIDNGNVVLHDGLETLPVNVKRIAGMQAATAKGNVIHLVGQNMTEQNARAVLLHEAFHSGAEKLIGTPQWNAMMKRLDGLYRQGQQSSGRARQFFDAARERVKAAEDKGAVGKNMAPEEFAAYAIEEYESAQATIRKWVDDLIGMVKAWVQAKFGKQFGDVTPGQLSALAKMALLDTAADQRGEMFGRVGELFSVNDDRTVEVDGVRRPITNSKGQLIHPDVRGQIAFWRWFGKSKIVDGRKPLVVYRGLGEEHGEFVGDKQFWTDDPQAASGYASSSGGEAPNVVAAYIKVDKPLDLDNDRLAKKLAKSLDQDFDPDAPRWELIDNFEAADAIRGMGYDGAMFNDMNSSTGDHHTTYVTFDDEQVKSATGNAGTFDGANPDIRYSVAAPTRPASTTAPAAPQQLNNGLVLDEPGRLRRIQAALQDNMNRVKQVQEKIAQVTGRPVREVQDYYGAETNRPGRIAARLEDAQKQLFTPLMEKLAKSGHTPEQLSELLHAMHAHERNEAVAKINPDMPNGGSGMTDAQAAAVLARYQSNRPLHALAEEARAIAARTLELKHAYGLISDEQYTTLSDMYENYVPLKGDGEFGPKVKRAMGHEERDEHILENIVRDYDQAVVVGEKNLARQSLLRLVLSNPDKNLWTVGVPPKGRYVAGQVYTIKKNGQPVASFTSKAQVAAFLEDRGPEASQYHVADSAGEQVKEFVKPLQDNEVPVYVKGDMVRIQINGDEHLARQLRPLNQGQMGVILESMRKLNRFLSSIYTGYNPAFILRNATRDAMTGTINMVGHQGAGTAAKAWLNYPKAAKALAQWAATGKLPQGETGRLLAEYRAHGGKTGASYMSDLEQQGKKLSRLYEDAYGAAAYAKDGKPTKAALVASRKIVGGLAHAVEIANTATENALRLALYMQLRDEGASAGKAAQAAKTVTVDFDRKGTMTPALGAIFLFFNPAVQGTANAVKTLVKGEHKAQAWTALGAIAALGFLAAAKGMDDDKDRWLGEGWETRSKNLILNIGGHQFRMPMSQEFAPVYAFGAAMAEASRGESKIATSLRIFFSFIDAYFPFNGAFKDQSDNRGMDLMLAMTPTVLQPGMQIAANRNSFGSQVVPDTELTKDRPDNLKMFRGTKGSAYDAAAQAIASAGELLGAGKYENDLTKVSPETLKLLWKTYTGGLGGFVADSIGLARLSTEPGATEINDVPILKDFVHTPDVKPIRARYYDLSREAKAAITEFQQAKKAGDGEALDKLVADPAKANVIGLGRMVQGVNKAVASIRDEEVSVNQDKSLSVADKRAKLKELEASEEAIYRDAIKAFQ